MNFVMPFIPLTKNEKVRNTNDDDFPGFTGIITEVGRSDTKERMFSCHSGFYYS